MILLEIFAAAIMHWVGYMIGTSCLLLLYSCTDQRLDSIFSFKIFKNDTIFSFFFICTMGSILGVPPFFGFWTKFYILYLVGVYGPFWLNVCMWGLSLSAMFFYMFVLQVIFSVTPQDKGVHLIVVSDQKFIYLLICVLFMCFGFVFLDQLFGVFLFLIL